MSVSRLTASSRMRSSASRPPSVTVTRYARASSGASSRRKYPRPSSALTRRVSVDGAMRSAEARSPSRTGPALPTDAKVDSWLGVRPARSCLRNLRDSRKTATRKRAGSMPRSLGSGDPADDCAPWAAAVSARGTAVIAAAVLLTPDDTLADYVPSSATASGTAPLRQTIRQPGAFAGLASASLVHGGPVPQRSAASRDAAAWRPQFPADSGLDRRGRPGRGHAGRRPEPSHRGPARRCARVVDSVGLRSAGGLPRRADLPEQRPGAGDRTGERRTGGLAVSR